MPQYLSPTDKAWSFSHGSVEMQGIKFDGLESLDFDQTLDESFVFGMSQKPLRRSPGRLQGGSGTVAFSDIDQWYQLADVMAKAEEKFMNVETNLLYTLVHTSGQTRSYELRGVRFTSLGESHASGADALAHSQPFSFMSQLLNGKEIV